MTYKRKSNSQHKAVVTDKQYRPKVAESKVRKEKLKHVPKNKILEEAAEVFDQWVGGDLETDDVESI